MEYIRIINEKLAIKFEKITNEMKNKKEVKILNVQKILTTNNDL